MVIKLKKKLKLKLNACSNDLLLIMVSTIGIKNLYLRTQ